MSDSSSNRLIVYASPLIYLAKLEAFEIFATDNPAAVSEGVRDEALLPQAAYQFPEIVAIDEAISRGRIEVVRLSKGERGSVETLGQRVPGLGRGELETLVVARSRHWSAVISDRRASAVARAHGIAVMGVVELLFARARDDRLADWIRGFARLVNMRLDVLEDLLSKLDARGRR